MCKVPGIMSGKWEAIKMVAIVITTICLNKRGTEDDITIAIEMGLDSKALGLEWHLIPPKDSQGHKKEIFSTRYGKKA